jgi:DNA-directed RNA polymerase subunit beta'
MKAIDLYINSVLPPDLRQHDRVLDKKGVETLMASVAKLYPDLYSDIVKRISDVGRNAVYQQGETLRLQDLRPVIDKEALFRQMDKELALVQKMPISDEDRAQRKMLIWSDYATRMDKATQDAALAQGNNLGYSVASGSRGNAFQLKAMLTTPALYTDYKDNPIPLFVRRSFSEGLRPSEYLASTFGVRKSVLGTKNATADSGDFLKQMFQSTANIIVTDDDCGTTNGLDYEADDKEIQGKVLAKTYGGMKPGTVIDKTVMGLLRKMGVEKVIARSPMTCQAKQGICAHCLGLLPEGKLAPIGYSAGVTAASSVGEPLTQGALNTKHGGGGFKGTKRTFAGFNIINQIAQSPDTFPYRAAVANVEGKVHKIEDAPQGGKFIWVGDEQHYALPGFEPTVKVGDSVEAGDTLSEGIKDVYDVLRTRGLGEAQRYYVDRLKQAFQDSDAGNPRKTQLEILARANLNHVVVEDPDGVGDYVPDDIANYSSVARNYSPPEDTVGVPLEKAVGRYLQAPALHFTINTKLTPKMLERIGAAGIRNVSVSDRLPKFRPEMMRLRAASHPGTDWLAKMHSSYLTSNLGADAARARETNVEHNVHFAPRLAIGKGFGEKIETTGEF